MRMRNCAVALAAAVLLAWTYAQANDLRYVGSKKCADCHQAEYDNYTKFAKKSHSAKSVKLMAPKLTPEELKGCFSCHTTGYGKPGGFKSFQETPDLADAGCEVCHGPGSAHIDSGGDPSKIKGKKRLTLKDCESCHNSERVGAFNFKPLIYGGAH